MNTTNAIQLFNYEDHDVRFIEDDGETWVIVKDVCDVLELSNPTRAIDGIEIEDLTLLEVRAGGQRRQMNAVNESGFYQLVFKSRKPEAKRFKRWVTSEVLPAIRKTGSYGAAQPNNQQLDVLMRGIGMLEQSFSMMGKALDRLADQNQRFEPKPRRRIKQSERDTILQMHREGHGPAPIADALDLNPGTVSSILSRARQTGELTPSMRN